jgi:hypothetical protein
LRSLIICAVLAEVSFQGDETGGTCSTHESYFHKISVGKFQRKRPTEKPRNKWEDNIKKILKEIGHASVAPIHMAQDE